jgi:hypothetical protein
MKKEYFDAIRGGRKTTSLRFWSRTMVRAGSVHRLCGAEKLRVLNVEQIAMGELGEQDAIADGFDGLRSLLAAVRRLYPPGTRGGRKLYRVRFKYIGAPARANPGGHGHGDGG